MSSAQAADWAARETARAVRQDEALLSVIYANGEPLDDAARQEVYNDLYARARLGN